MNLATSISPDLWAAIRRSYEAQAWSNVILDAVHFLSDVIRNKSGLQSDGTALAGQAFGGRDPKIKLTRLITETDKNVQAGVEQMMRGIYQAIRNPRSHDRLNDSQHEADAIVVFINYLLGVIGHAKSAFSIEEILERIADENFVPNKRYAELILKDIPAPKLLDTVIAAFDSRDVRNALHLKPFFQAAMDSLGDVDKGLFFEAVSAHLRSSTEDLELKSVFQLLVPSQWLKLGEAERMRSENRIVRSIASGKYSSRSEKCLSGGLATWARSFLPEFTLKGELLSELHRALSSSNRERQDYVFRYFFTSLPDLAERPPNYYVSHIKRQLERGDSRYKAAIEDLQFYDQDEWTKPFELAMKGFQERDDVAPVQDFLEGDEIPF